MTSSHLDPSPHRREKRRRIDDSNGTQCFWVVCSSKGRCLLKVFTPIPQGAERDLLEIDDGSDGGYWCWFCGVGQMAAYW